MTPTNYLIITAIVIGLSDVALNLYYLLSYKREA
jgi:multisubunit Na+/H+ antiporter MnhC subunit